MSLPKFYVEVEGTKIPAGFSPENFKSGASYQPKDTDIFICTFPKCGTNWTKRIVQLLINRESQTGEVADYGLSKCFLEMAGESGDITQFHLNFSPPLSTVFCTDPGLSIAEHGSTIIRKSLLSS